MWLKPFSIHIDNRWLKPTEMRNEISEKNLLK